MSFTVGFSGRESAIRAAALVSVLLTGVLFLLPLGSSSMLRVSELGSSAAAAALLVALWWTTMRTSDWDRVAWAMTAGSSTLLVMLYLIDPVRPGSSATEFSVAFTAGPAISLVQLAAVAVLARRVVRSVPAVRLALDSVWLASAGLLITWGVIAGPVVDRSDLGRWPTISLVAQTSAAALLLGFVAGLAILAGPRGRLPLLTASIPALATTAMQVVYERSYVNGRLGVGSLADFVLPVSFSLAALAALEWRRSSPIGAGPLRPGRGQMAITLVPLAIWGLAVTMSRLSAVPEERWLGVVIGALAIVRLIVLVSENARMAADLQEHSSRDDLTGLPNLAAVESLAHDMGDGPAAMIVVDLQRFKGVNDTFGHIAGDRLLVLVGQRIEYAVGPGWITARSAGAEFVALSTTETDPQLITEVGRRIIERLSLPFHLNGREAWLGARVGVATTEHGLHPSELLEVADLALRKAGGDSSGDVVIVDGQMIQRARGRHSLEVAIRHAIERDEFFTVYQPKVDITTGAMVGMEALVRWERPGVGFVPPDEFIPVAESTGLVSRIDSWVLADAATHLREWNELRGSAPRLKLSVNMSAWQLSRVDVDAEVSRTLASVGGVDPAQLTVELTETVLIDDPDVVARRLQKLRGAGVGISVDDFGSGFTSVAYLRKFPVTEVKIDRDLVWELDGTRTDNKSLAAAVIALAHAMELGIVAEGVETLEQAESLKRLGARVVQGYYFAKPLRAEEIDEIITDPFPFAHLIAGEVESTATKALLDGGTPSSRL